MSLKTLPLWKRCPGTAQILKGHFSFLRYWKQSLRCRLGYIRYSDAYPQSVLLIAGLPKSGTTWLETMLASYPGFHTLLIPEATGYELQHGGSHGYDLPPDIFSRMKNKLVVSKMHIHGSDHNVQLIHGADIRYVVLFRDLRDVSVSYYFYVRQTPWHPGFEKYRGLNVEQGLRLFAEELLVPYKEWVNTWEKNRDPRLSLMLKYEDLLADSREKMTQVADHFRLDSSPEIVRRVIEKHTFKRMSGGRKAGQERETSFYRKGQSGDWKNHFTPELKKIFNEKVGEFLVRHDYEENDGWALS